MGCRIYGQADIDSRDKEIRRLKGQLYKLKRKLQAENEKECHEHLRIQQETEREFVGRIEQLQAENKRLKEEIERLKGYEEYY